MAKKFVVLLWVLIVPIFSWGQVSTGSGEPEIDCVSPALTRADTNLISQNATLDSVAALLAGRWKLIKVEDGWSTVKTLNWLSELIVDRNGQCIVRVDGNWVSSFHITLTRERGGVFFAVDQHKGARFPIGPTSRTDQSGRKRAVRGRLRLGESALSFAGSGTNGQFCQYERLTKQEPDMASLTPIACRDSLSQVEQVQRVEGIVLFRDDLQAYVIDCASVAKPSSHLIGIICNWPQASDYVNKTVNFSGNYFDLPAKKKSDGEPERVYYLRITGFHPME